MLGSVAAVEEVRDLVAGERPDGLLGAEDRAAERAVAEDHPGEEVVDDVARVVLGHRHLFQDDAAFGLDVVRADQRAGEHVADHVDGQRQVGVEHPRVVAGVLLRGEGVHLAADRVQGGRDVQRAAPLGALEEQVLQVVRGAVELGVSSREPTPTQMPKVAERTVGRVSVTTRRPPGRTVRRTIPAPSAPFSRVRVVPGRCVAAEARATGVPP